MADPERDKNWCRGRERLKGEHYHTGIGAPFAGLLPAVDPQYAINHVLVKSVRPIIPYIESRVYVDTPNCRHHMVAILSLLAAQRARRQLSLAHSLAKP